MPALKTPRPKLTLRAAPTFIDRQNQSKDTTLASLFARPPKHEPTVLGEPLTVVCRGRCEQLLSKIRPGIARLAFLDTPYNIGVNYDVTNDNLPTDEFWAFIGQAISRTARTLTDDGSLWIWALSTAVHRYIALAEANGLTLINNCCVVQRFGQHQDGKFISGHSGLAYLAKDPKHRVWNPDAVLETSLRASKYKDKRTQHTATPGQRVPLDVWGFDEPYFGRVQGNNQERRPLHPNQVPEAVIRRILLATTNPGDLVLDPFLGSGTTCTVARALGRRSLGIDISEKYIRSALERINQGPVR